MPLINRERDDMFPLWRDVLRLTPFIKRGKSFSLTVDFPNINATTRGSVAVTVPSSPGIAIGDAVIVKSGFELLEDDIIFVGAKVTAADQITFYAYNPTAGGINPASQTFSITWFDLT